MSTKSETTVQAQPPSAVACSDLLACRCGKEPNIERSQLMGYVFYWVECDCGHDGPAYYNRTQAIGAWNAQERRQANDSKLSHGDGKQSLDCK